MPSSPFSQQTLGWNFRGSTRYLGLLHCTFFAADIAEIGLPTKISLKSWVFILLLSIPGIRSLSEGKLALTRAVLSPVPFPAGSNTTSRIRQGSALQPGVCKHADVRALPAQPPALMKSRTNSENSMEKWSHGDFRLKFVKTGGQFLRQTLCCNTTASNTAPSAYKLRCAPQLLSCSAPRLPHTG